MGMTKLLFLSDQWIESTKSIAEDYKDQIPESPIDTKINININEVSHRDNQQLQGHIDTTQKTPVIEVGHIEDTELTISIGYETAKSIFFRPDPQELMQAFLGGKILIEGDASKLLAMQTNASDPSPEAIEFYEKIEEITDF